jgi:hypothetical protein
VIEETRRREFAGAVEGKAGGGSWRFESRDALCAGPAKSSQAGFLDLSGWCGRPSPPQRPWWALAPPKRVSTPARAHSSPFNSATLMMLITWRCVAVGWFRLRITGKGAVQLIILPCRSHSCSPHILNHHSVLFAADEPANRRPLVSSRRVAHGGSLATSHLGRDEVSGFMRAVLNEIRYNWPLFRPYGRPLVFRHSPSTSCKPTLAGRPVLTTLIMYANLSVTPSSRR